MQQIEIEMLIKKALEKDIGEKVRMVRLSKKKTKVDMAKYLKLSKEQIDKYEKGINRIAVSRLDEIAKFLKVDIVELLPKSIKEN